MIPNFEEEIEILATCEANGTLWYAFGGLLKVIYVCNIGTQEVIEVCGHLKTVTDVKLTKLDNTPSHLLLMSASEDFSVRLWLINTSENSPGAKYIQLVHYLDVN